MPIPLLEIVPKTQNQRVAGYDVPDEDDPVVYRLSATSSETDVSDLIWAAYRQVFGEHLILDSYRQPFLESQLRNRAITVRDFMRGLGKTDTYRELVADTNSNYRLVDITFKRFLGRSSYGKDEQIAWSIVVATRGLHGFIDAVVDSDEYKQNFGDDVVPYQRRRMEGRPFNLVTPRYADYWRNRETLLGLQSRSYYQVREYRSGELDRQVIRQAIPLTFLQMAQGILAPEQNYQRTSDQARSRVASYKVPEAASNGSSDGDVAVPSVRRTEAALPYRYIPGNAKV